MTRKSSRSVRSRTRSEKDHQVEKLELCINKKSKAIRTRSKSCKRAVLHKTRKFKSVKKSVKRRRC